MSENKTYLRFACGARLPETGYLNEPWTPQVRKMYQEDGRRLPKRFPLVVFGDDSARPVRWDGSLATCLFGCCPCARKAGRRLRRHLTENGMGLIVTCCPEEIEVTDPATVKDSLTTQTKEETNA